MPKSMVTVPPSIRPKSCHPERSEGSMGPVWIPRFARDDTAVLDVGQGFDDLVAGGHVALLVHRLQADMGGAGLEVATQAAAHRVGVAPQAHRVDEAVAAAVGEIGLAEALAQPVVAVVLEDH